MWVLVFILISNATPNAIIIDEFDTMTRCFQERQFQLEKLDAYEGIPPVNTQLICIRTE